MRRLLTLTVAVAVLFGIYTFVFGLPEQIAKVINSNTSVQTTTQAPSGGQAGGQRGPGGPGGRAGGGNSTTTVVTVPLDLMPYETVLNAIGTATAQRSADVKSDAAGEVIELNLTANSYVEEGDALLRLDARTEELNLEIAQTQLDHADETLARYDRLKAIGNSTVTEVALAETRIEQRLAAANVGLAQLALDNRTVRAPFAGKLGLSDVELGDVLSVNDAIVTIDNDDTLLIAFELPERAIGILTEVNTILASTPTFTGRVFDGEIVSFDSRLDSVTRSVTVKAEIDNESGALWPGMTFAVRMLHESDPMPAVPSTAITWSRTGSSVWVDVDGKAEQVPVTILFRRDETVWIEGDVPEGTTVVTEGVQKLRVGSQISTANQPAQPRPQTSEVEGLQPAATSVGKT